MRSFKLSDLETGTINDSTMLLVSTEDGGKLRSMKVTAKQLKQWLSSDISRKLDLILAELKKLNASQIKDIDTSIVSSKQFQKLDEIAKDVSQQSTQHLTSRDWVKLIYAAIQMGKDMAQ